MGWIDDVVHAIQLGVCVSAAQTDGKQIKAPMREDNQPSAGEPRLENLCSSSKVVAQVSVGWIDDVVHAIQSGLCVSAAQIAGKRIKTPMREDNQPSAGDPRLENLCSSS